MMVRSIYLSATLVWLAGVATVAQTESFAFAGLGLKLTMADLKSRYPRSTALDELVYLSADESHDHIATIGLSTHRDVRTLTITFERPQRDGRPTYPPCEDLVSVLTRQYGSAASVVDSQEEQAVNRRFEWQKSTESLTLRCFRMPRQRLYAERLTITSR